MFAILFIIPITLMAQEVQSIEYDYTDGNGYTCKSTLYLHGKESTFTINDDRTSGTHEDAQGHSYKLYNDKWSKIFYKNGSTTLTRLPLYGKELVYQSSDEIIKLVSETKQIDKFKCQKATISKGGRNYEIWFTDKIPVNVGPMCISNTPGLIVELKEIGGESIKFKFVQISKQKDIALYNSYKKYILEKKPISFDSYKKDVTKIMANTKRENAAYLAEMSTKYNTTINVSFSEDQRYYTCHLVDVPENLVKDLQKIK